MNTIKVTTEPTIDLAHLMVTDFPIKAGNQTNRVSVLEVLTIILTQMHKIKSIYLLKYRISLESNISAKARDKFNNYDLFEKLAYE